MNDLFGERSRLRRNGLDGGEEGFGEGGRCGGGNFGALGTRHGARGAECGWGLEYELEVDLWMVVVCNATGCVITRCRAVSGLALQGEQLFFAKR